VEHTTGNNTAIKKASILQIFTLKSLNRQFYEQYFYLHATCFLHVNKGKGQQPQYTYHPRQAIQYCKHNRVLQYKTVTPTLQSLHRLSFHHTSSLASGRYRREVPFQNRREVPFQNPINFLWLLMSYIYIYIWSTYS